MDRQGVLAPVSVVQLEPSQGVRYEPEGHEQQNAEEHVHSQHIGNEAGEDLRRRTVRKQQEGSGSSGAKKGSCAIGRQTRTSGSEYEPEGVRKG